MTKLRNLELFSGNLYNDRITDAGLPDLERLTMLDWLDIEQTDITPNGRERLRRALPEATIMWSLRFRRPHPFTAQ